MNDPENIDPEAQPLPIYFGLVEVLAEVLGRETYGVEAKQLPAWVRDRLRAVGARDAATGLPPIPPAPVAAGEESPAVAVREAALKLAARIADIATGNGDQVDPDHDVHACDVCARVADLILDFARLRGEATVRQEGK